MDLAGQVLVQDHLALWPHAFVGFFQDRWQVLTQRSNEFLGFT